VPLAGLGGMRFLLGCGGSSLQGGRPERLQIAFASAAIRHGSRCCVRCSGDRAGCDDTGLAGGFRDHQLARLRPNLAKLVRDCP